MLQTVHLYIFEGFADWEPAFATAGINDPTFQREPGRWRVSTVARSRAPLCSAGGLTLVPDETLDMLDPDDSAMLILPGGGGWEQPLPHAAAVGRAAAFLAAGKPVAAICGATAGLARAGLLQQRQHTSNALAYLQGTDYAASDFYCDQPAVRDRGLITAGGMSPVAFAREIFAELGVYTDRALEAWYQLYTTGQSRHYAELARAAA